MVTLGPLDASDFPLLDDLARRIWPVAYAGILSSEQLENLLSRIYCPENLAKEQAEGHRFWGAFSEGKALGFASGYREDGIIWIKKLYILPEAQGKGAGSALMQAVIEAFSPANEARLFVNSENRAAQNFYKRQGFSCVETTPVKMGDFTFTDFIFAKPLV
jgi:ribosomal protein S18 acetylase RimI-like enzyme